MATRTKTYAGMLGVQSDMAFPYEQALHEHEIWRSARRVIDFGCGNCAHAARLHDEYSGKEFFCIESDADMRSQALVNLQGRSMRIDASGDHVDESSQDFFLARLVLLHLADRTSVYRLAREKLRPGGGLLIIDADDQNFFIHPEPTRFLGALSALRSKSKNRNLRKQVDNEVQPFGFDLLREHRIVVNSSGRLAKLQMYMYMKLTAEMALDGRREDEIEDELLAWYQLPEAYAQYGVFGRLYELTK